MGILVRCSGVVAAAVAAAASASAAAGPIPARPPNPVVSENAAGGATGWAGPTAPASIIDGYVDEPSAVAGQTLHFHVGGAPGRYRVELYRLGWYAGLGARIVACLPSCSGDEPVPPQGGQAGDGLDTPIVATWGTTDTVTVGSDWTSGYYMARFALTAGPNTGRGAVTYFVVRQDPSQPPSQVLVQVPVNTWQAYNQWGGKSLYDFGGPRGRRVSFRRPYGNMAQSPLWYELQLVRFLEREGYDVSYQTDGDTDHDPTSLLRHRVVIVNGHDEYWTLGIRDAFDAALAAGTNLAFVGSNIGYWVVRYEDGGSTIYTQKSLYDPNPVLSQKTAMFREIGRPECELMGVEHQDFPHNYSGPLDFTVPDAAAADPWLAGTGLVRGSVVRGVVGREFDALAPWGGCMHPGTTVLFHYQGSPGSQDADAVRFTAPSGARVFAAGAQRLSWALDDYRSSLDASQPVPVDPRVQQFMRNALDDLTRPAAPAAATLTRKGDVLRVSVGAAPDPRVVGFASAIWADGRWQRLCRGTTSCSRTLPAAAPPLAKIGIVALDQWHRRSAPVFING
jgi:hypothetical protein